MALALAATYSKASRTNPLKDAKEFVKKVRYILKKKEDFLGIEVSEVFLGGSLGQGTSLPGHFDIDLVVYSSSLHPSTRRISGMDYNRILGKTMTCLKNSIGDIQNKERLFHGWKFNTSHLNVDLQFSPQWKEENMEDMYEYLENMNPPRRCLFYCGAYKFQTQLIKSQPQEVKILIRRFKMWRNGTWDTMINGCPKSYLISMLVLISYDRAPAEIKHNSFKELAKWMNEDIKELVENIAKNKDLDLHIPGENPLIMQKYSQYLPKKPRIIEPANPFMNLYVKGVALIRPERKDTVHKRWELFLKEIHTLDLTVDF